MTQSRMMSLVEAVTNVAVGYGLAVITQIIVMAVMPGRRHVRPPLRSSKAAFVPQGSSSKNDYGTVLRLER